MDPSTLNRLSLARVGAAVLLVVAFCAFYFGEGIPSLRMASMVLLALSVLLVLRSRGSNAHRPSAESGTSESRKVRWWLGVLLVGIAILSRLLLDYAAAHDLWRPYPLYLFAASVAAVAWWAFGALTNWR
jgi:hypothetical protein